MIAADSPRTEQVDVLVVGAGFSGLYMVHQLHQLGMSVLAVDSARDVGGTWYWNRYPGARCDIPTTDYVYSFDPELEHVWTWSEKYATQPEILAYLRFVADRYDLRRDICFSTQMVAATWDEARACWHVVTEPSPEPSETGLGPEEPVGARAAQREIDCRFLVMATGCLSVPKELDIEGVERFAGSMYVTGRWPHEPVDFTAKRVAVIGTGSSGIQCIPLIAEQAAELTVFQRTANFSVPAHNGPVPASRLAALSADRDGYRHAARYSRGGVPTDLAPIGALAASPELRRERFEAAWAAGELFAILSVFSDQLVDLAANEVVAEMIREKIRATVPDPGTAEALCPKDHPFGTKRPCLDSGYYQSFTLPHVRLVDLRRDPITSITESGIETADRFYPADAIVFATGFDAMTGALLAPQITGRGGVTLRECWADGPSTYLGLTVSGFPNFFTITGPQSPSVLSNMAVSIEQHVEWITTLLEHMRRGGFDTVEPTARAQAGWTQHAADCAAITLHPRADSWYMGANVVGKPRVLYPYIGGVDNYRRACDEVAERGYLGLRLCGPAGEQCVDGVVRRLQPDVAMVLDFVASLGLPPLHQLEVADARALAATTAAERPPGPEVGECTDGVLGGPVGELAYRLYRPPTPGPHPIVAYFHGGGWVLGGVDSDEPLCRDLCVRADAVVISVDYRHAPEARFPAAVDDAYGALCWIAAHAEELGGRPGPVAVAGWSAGGNLAAVCCQLARDAGAPAIGAQMLLSPVTDCDLDRPSYEENAEGYILTTAMMRWFWDNYADPGVREDPKASPLRGDLRGLPPAVVVTAEFDPLRDEGLAYAEALAAAGVAVRHIFARGHTHTSLTMVDVVLSGAPVRGELAEALRALLDVAVPAPCRRGGSGA